MTHEFADKKLAYIRDLFVFASFTALSFVDINELITDDIVEIKVRNGFYPSDTKQRSISK